MTEKDMIAEVAKFPFTALYGSDILGAPAVFSTMDVGFFRSMFDDYRVEAHPESMDFPINLVAEHKGVEFKCRVSKSDMENIVAEGVANALADYTKRMDALKREADEYIAHNL